MADTKDQVKSGIDNAADKAKNLTDRGAEAAKSAQGTAGSVVDSVKDRAQSVAHGAQQKVSEWAHDARQAGENVQRWATDVYDDNIKDIGRDVTDMVRRYPIPALLVGFGVGMLLGRVASRA